MLTRKVTDDDRFTRLSSSAQALYMHLNMSADDDGFNSQVSIAMFRAHASVGDLEALLSGRFILQFDNGVIVIKHWRMANALRKDRYTPTAFKEELAKLNLKENGAYTERLPDGCQMVAKRLPDGCHSIDKKRVEKERVEENKRACARDEDPGENDGFDAFWNAYPRKSGDIRQVYFEYLGVIRQGVKPETLLEAVTWQAAEKGQYMPNADKWLRNRGWTEQKNASAQKKNNADIQAERERFYTQAAEEMDWESLGDKI